MVCTVTDQGPDPDMEKEMMKIFPRFKKICLTMSEQLLAKNIASFAEFKNSSPEQHYVNLLKKDPVYCKESLSINLPVISA